MPFIEPLPGLVMFILDTPGSHALRGNLGLAYETPAGVGIEGADFAVVHARCSLCGHGMPRVFHPLNPVYPVQFQKPRKIARQGNARQQNPPCICPGPAKA